MSRRSAPRLDPAAIEALRDVKRPELVDRWKAALGTDPPRRASQALLARLLAYELQAAAYGGLSARTRAKLTAIASGEAPKLAAPRLKPGARLVREWNGVLHTVEAVEGGFLYREERFRSLSSIARRITGAHWSGPRFFGLVRRGGGQP